MASKGQNFSTNSTCSSFPICWTISPVSQAMYVTSLFVVIAYSVPLNCWVLWLRATQASLKRSSEILAIHLATMDLLSCFAIGLLVLVNFICSETLKTTYLCVNFASFYGRMLFNAAVCVERYLAVVHPVKYLSSKMVKFRSLCVWLTWLVALSFGLAHPLGGLPLQVYMLPFCATLLMTTFCSLAILKELRKPKPGDGESKNIDQAKRNAFKIIMFILVLTSVCYISHISLRAYQFAQDIYCFTGTISIWLFLLSYVPHPLVYLYKAGALKCTGSLSRKN